MQAIQMHLSQKQRKFSELFCAFSKFTTNFQHFKKKIALIAYVFPKLRSTKDVVR